MADKKYCPLKYTLKHGLEYCSEKRCAWWNNQIKCCAIIVIGNKIALTQVGKR